jgi:hypothetical protein
MDRLGFAALDGKHTLMRALFLVSSVLLIGNSVAEAQDRTLVMGFETYVVVAPAADESAALRNAEAHCAKYNRFAHFRRMDGVKAVFDCELRKLEKKPFGIHNRGVF